ncbi:MAG TPA: aldehyde ferredoxin oxidoreductase family protein [Candidatus Deferrimicrobium sp.]|nr:aldehyde ferredoxin oxidoreductase family protein [Candidatus Deferrimicrobium sp.]
MYGYFNKLLRVNLTTLKSEDYPLDPEKTKMFIGGAGLACRMMYDLVDQNTDPLGPENPLFFMTGPLTGTNVPTAGRTTITAKSPLTKIWGESSCGGTFAAWLRFAGYDGILVEGQAKNLVSLYIKDGSVEIKDASHLKGKNTFETKEILVKELNDENIRIMCIGPAGENLVKFASIVHPDARKSVAGRTGLGAVMGSKRLKAIVVQSTKKEIPVADPEKLKEQSKEIAKVVMENFGNQMFQSLGTAGYVDMGNAMGDLSSKYFTLGENPDAYNVSGSTMKEKILVKNTGCYRCPVRCGREIEIKEGKYKLLPNPGPEYENIGALGTNLMIGDLEAVSYLSLLCDKMGMDTISCGVTIGFALYLYEKGLLTKNETGGIELTWGNPELVEKLIHMITTRQGFGDLLAEGSRRLAEKFEVSQDEVAAVKGLEIPFHDPRAYSGMALTYAFSTRGACHNHADYYLATIGNIGPGVYPLGVESLDRFQSEGVAKSVALLEDYRALYGSLIMCVFVNPPPEHVINALNYALGTNYDMDAIKLIGERILTMKRLFNHKMGLTAKDDRLPKIILQPLEGGQDKHVPDFPLMLREYYAFRNWDPETGKPSKEKLEKLGLAEFIPYLWK